MSEEAVTQTIVVKWDGELIDVYSNGTVIIPCTGNLSFPVNKLSPDLQRLIARSVRHWKRTKPENRRVLYTADDAEFVPMWRRLVVGGAVTVQGLVDLTLGLAASYLIFRFVLMLTGGEVGY